MSLYVSSFWIEDHVVNTVTGERFRAHSRPAATYGAGWDRHGNWVETHTVYEYRNDLVVNDRVSLARGSAETT